MTLLDRSLLFSVSLYSLDAAGAVGQFVAQLMD
jgi:hypothetical protein